MDRTSIAKDYLKLWFWIDLFSSIPYTWIIAAAINIDIQTLDSDAPSDVVLNTVLTNSTLTDGIFDYNSSLDLTNNTITNAFINAT